jgi:hypothetical protein
LLAEALHLCHRRDRCWVAWRRWRSSSLDDLGSCLKRETETERGERREEGTSEDTICLSNKEMQSVLFFCLAQSKAVLLSCGERESQRGRESEVTSSLRSRVAPLSRRRETIMG